LLILRSLLQEEVISRGSSVRVAISKVDLLQPATADSNSITFLNSAVADYEKFGTECFDDFGVIKISSSPKKGSGLSYAFGLDQLFSEWITVREKKLVSFAIPQPTGKEREAQRFLWLQLGVKH
jgi:hypothetical protein